MTEPFPSKSKVPDWIPIAALLAVVVYVYWPVLWHEFLAWDDAKSIPFHPNFNPPTIAHWLDYWRHAYFDLYIPVTYTVLMAIAAAARTSPDASGMALNPFVFHAANVMVHAASAMLVFAILRELGAKRCAAWAGAMLFAIHPLQVETVSWVSGMKDVLCGMLSLWATWEYVKYAKCMVPSAACGLAVGSAEFASGAEADCKAATRLSSSKSSDELPQRAARLHYALSLLAFILAMLAKPSAVTLPFALCALDVGLIRPRRWREAAWALAPFIVASLPVVVIAKYVQPAHPMVVSDSVPMWWRGIVAIDAIGFYLQKLVAPIRLAPDYGRTPALLYQHRELLLLTWLVALAVAMAIWTLRRRATWLFVSAAIFVAALLPVLGFVRFEFQDYSTTADHYVYFAMFGVALAVALGLSRVPAQVGMILAGVALLALGQIAHRQTRMWHNTQRLFEHNLSVNPSSIAAHINLGNEYQRQGAFDAAAEDFRAAIKQQPDQPDGYVNLGNVYAARKNYIGALNAYRDAIRVKPDHFNAHFALANLLAEMDRRDEAIAAFKGALAVAPSSAQAHTNLARLLLLQGRYEEAIEHYRAALAIDPELPQARNGMKMAEQFRSAASTQPTKPSE